MTPEEHAKKRKIACGMLPRYLGAGLVSMPHDFGRHVLLTNFSGYLYKFVELMDARVSSAPIDSVRVYSYVGEQGKPMQFAYCDGLTMINFGIGAPNAALVADLLGCFETKAALFLGKCGGLNDHKRKIGIGDFILPTAAIRGDGTSDNYYPREIPALPSFQLHKVVAEQFDKNIFDSKDWEEPVYHCGTVYTTNRRLWEHDEQFKDYLKLLRCIGIEMETAAWFIAAFHNHIPHGALLLVSDMPLVEAKNEQIDSLTIKRAAKKLNCDWKDLDAQYHVGMGIQSLMAVKNSGHSVRYMGR